MMILKQKIPELGPQPVPPDGDDDGFLGPVGGSATEVRFFHFATVF